MKYTTKTKEDGPSGSPAYEQEMTFKGDMTLAIETTIAD